MASSDFKKNNINKAPKKPKPNPNFFTMHMEFSHCAEPCGQVNANTVLSLGQYIPLKSTNPTCDVEHDFPMKNFAHSVSSSKFKRPNTHCHGINLREKYYCCC